MAKNGVLASSGEKNHLPYEHAIATYALAEAVAFCEQVNINIPNLMKVTRAAGEFIIGNQHESGGWDYGYDQASGRGGDLSISSWQIIALATCRAAGVPLKNLEPCIKRALDYVEQRQGSDGGFGYTGKGDSRAANDYSTLTGAGMLCLQMWNKASAGSVRSGAKYLEKKSRFDFNGEDCDLYGHYYEALAMRQRGGDSWKAHQARVMPQLIENQQVDGSWKPPGGGKKPNAVASAFITHEPGAAQSLAPGYVLPPLWGFRSYEGWNCSQSKPGFKVRVQGPGSRSGSAAEQFLRHLDHPVAGGDEEAVPLFRADDRPAGEAAEGGGDEQGTAEQEAG